MEKEKILIHRIQDGEFKEKTDEVAVEQQIEVEISAGNLIRIACTPTYLEEMTAAKRFLAGTARFAAQESEKVNALERVKMEEIFAVARDSFENPGSLFADTGCAHSCALIHEGEIVCCIEDIGRHNALDKVIGFALLQEIPMKECYVFTSGRVSADYLQKVIAAGFPMVVSRAAVTGTAAALAKENNVTLLGFVRKNAGNLYHEGAVKICE